MSIARRPDARHRRAAGLVACLVALSACGAPDPTATGDAVSTRRPSPSDAPRSATPTTAAAADLDRLLEMLEATHPEPFHSVDRDEFVAALEAYEARLATLTPNESVVELMRVVATLSRGGRDGHQFALPMDGHDGPMLPIRVYEFAEGVFVTDALAPHEDLAGARITAVEGTPIADVLDLVEPLVPRDGPATVSAFRPILLLRTAVLDGLGLLDSTAAVEITVEDAGGASRTVALEPIPVEAHVDWAGAFGTHQLPLDPAVRYLAAAEPFSWTELPDGRTLYLRYRFVAPPNVAPARERLEAGGVGRVILDLRQNPGGDNTTFSPLLALVRDFADATPGGLVVLTDRVTFSAAANLATQIEQSTDATFVGEAMGGGLNFWNDVRWVELEALPVPMRVGISTRYWQMAEPDDPRLTIEPDVPVAVTAADHFAGRDPAFEAALTVRP